MAYSDYRWFRHFYWYSTASMILILFVAGLGLRQILRNLVVSEAENNAIRISTVVRDHQMRAYISQHHSTNERFLTIPPAELDDVDDLMRVFIASFEIVKTKIYNTEPRVIYSTDPKAIGRLDTQNVSLSAALEGRTSSKHERKDEVWDLVDEEHINVEIVETYVPMYGINGKIIGSFEIYKDITRNLKMADRIFIRSWGTLAVTVLGVFAILMLVLRKANKAINLSTAELMAANERLHHEIVEHKQADQSLRESQERFRDFFKNAPVGFHIFGPDRKIMDMNEAELDMIGYTKDEIVGKKIWADLILPEQKAEFEKHWCDIIAKGQVRSLNYTLVHKDGRHIDVLLNASARFSDKGQLVNTRGSVLNITERRRLERELLTIIERERQRTGHELHDSIGQQLTGIAFMAEVLGDKLHDKSLAEERSYAEKLNACISQAVEQTRHLAKGLHPIDLDRNGLASALQELAVNTEQLFDVSCTLSCPESVSIHDASVAIHLYRIAQEAITNAVRHGKAKHIKIELMPRGDGLGLTVENDGLEFPAGQIQTHGMGLRIMHYRAEIINGSLSTQKGTQGGARVACVFRNKQQPKQ